MNTNDQSITYYDFGENIVERALEKTLEFVQSRYMVVQAFDRFESPTKKYKNDKLWKVRNGQNEIMWVYYIRREKAHYVSVETKPDYVATVRDKLNCFVVTNRKTYPQLKLAFTNYDRVSDALACICDSIDDSWTTENMRFRSVRSVRNRSKRLLGKAKFERHE